MELLDKGHDRDPLSLDDWEGKREVFTDVKDEKPFSDVKVECEPADDNAGDHLRLGANCKESEQSLEEKVTEMEVFPALESIETCSKTHPGSQQQDTGHGEMECAIGDVAMEQNLGDELPVLADLDLQRTLSVGNVDVEGEMIVPDQSLSELDNGMSFEEELKILQLLVSDTCENGEAPCKKEEHNNAEGGILHMASSNSTRPKRSLEVLNSSGQKKRKVEPSSVTEDLSVCARTSEIPSESRVSCNELPALELSRSSRYFSYKDKSKEEMSENSVVASLVRNEDSSEHNQQDSSGRLLGNFESDTPTADAVLPEEAFTFMPGANRISNDECLQESCLSNSAMSVDGSITKELDSMNESDFQVFHSPDSHIMEVSRVLPDSVLGGISMATFVKAEDAIEEERGLDEEPTLCIETAVIAPPEVEPLTTEDNRNRIDDTESALRVKIEPLDPEVQQHSFDVRIHSASPQVCYQRTFSSAESNASSHTGDNLALVDNESATTSEPSMTRPDFTCQECKRNFSSASTLRRHVKNQVCSKRDKEGVDKSGPQPKGLPSKSLSENSLADVSADVLNFVMSIVVPLNQSEPDTSEELPESVSSRSSNVASETLLNNIKIADAPSSDSIEGQIKISVAVPRNVPNQTAVPASTYSSSPSDLTVACGSSDTHNLKCPHCEKHFSSKHSLRRHVRKQVCSKEKKLGALSDNLPVIDLAEQEDLTSVQSLTMQSSGVSKEISVSDLPIEGFVSQEATLHLASRVTHCDNLTELGITLKKEIPDEISNCLEPESVLLTPHHSLEYSVYRVNSVEADPLAPDPLTACLKSEIKLEPEEIKCESSVDEEFQNNHAESDMNADSVTHTELKTCYEVGSSTLLSPGPADVYQFDDGLAVINDTPASHVRVEYTCQDCKRTFSSASTLRRHVKNKVCTKKERERTEKTKLLVQGLGGSSSKEHVGVEILASKTAQSSEEPFIKEEFDPYEENFSLDQEPGSSTADAVMLSDISNTENGPLLADDTSATTSNVVYIDNEFRCVCEKVFSTRYTLHRHMKQKICLKKLGENQEEPESEAGEQRSSSQASGLPASTWSSSEDLLSLQNSAPEATLQDCPEPSAPISSNEKSDGRDCVRILACNRATSSEEPFIKEEFDPYADNFSVEQGHGSSVTEAVGLSDISNTENGTSHTDDISETNSNVVSIDNKLKCVCEKVFSTRYSLHRHMKKKICLRKLEENQEEPESLLSEYREQKNYSQASDLSASMWSSSGDLLSIQNSAQEVSFQDCAEPPAPDNSSNENPDNEEDENNVNVDKDLSNISVTLCPLDGLLNSESDRSGEENLNIVAEGDISLSAAASSPTDDYSPIMCDKSTSVNIVLKCEKCLKVFSSNDSLRRHLRKNICSKQKSFVEKGRKYFQELRRLSKKRESRRGANNNAKEKESHLSRGRNDSDNEKETSQDNKNGTAVECNVEDNVRVSYSAFANGYIQKNVNPTSLSEINEPEIDYFEGPDSVANHFCEENLSSPPELPCVPNSEQSQETSAVDPLEVAEPSSFSQEISCDVDSAQVVDTSPTNSVDFECATCRRSFVTQQSLLRHMRKHCSKNKKAGHDWEQQQRDRSPPVTGQTTEVNSTSAESSLLRNFPLEKQEEQCQSSKSSDIAEDINKEDTNDSVMTALAEEFLADSECVRRMVSAQRLPILADDDDLDIDGILEREESAKSTVEVNESSREADNLPAEANSETSKTSLSSTYSALRQRKSKINTRVGFQCTSCQKCYATKHSLRRHQHNVCSKKRKEEGNEEEVISNSSKSPAAQRPKSSKSGGMGSGEMWCHICHRGFGNLGATVSHMTRHKEKDFCDKCQVTCAPMHRIKFHTRFFPFPCEPCGDFFPNKKSLRVHEEKCLFKKRGARERKNNKREVGEFGENARRQTRKSNKVDKVGIFNGSVPSESSEKDTASPFSNTTPPVESGEKVNVCHVCSRRFSLKRGLTLHLKTHNKDSSSAIRVNKISSKCSICEKKFKTKIQCQKHMAEHAEDPKAQSCQDKNDSVQNVGIRPCSVKLFRNPAGNWILQDSDRISK